MKKINYIFIIIPLFLLACKPYNHVQQKIVEANQDSILIVTQDNKTYHGVGEIPNLSSKSIKIVSKEKGEKEIPSSEIAYLLAWHQEKDKDMAHRFVYTTVEEYKSLDVSDLSKKQKTDSRWLLEVCTVDSITMYVEHQEYTIHKEGNIDGFTSGVVSNPPNTWYYLKKDGEAMPIRIGLDASAGAVADKYFKNMGQKYFSDSPTICSKIKDGKLNTETIENAMIKYSKYRQ